MALNNYGVVVMPITCVILTIAAYLYVKELRNTLGKCVISCLFNIFMWQSLALVQMWFSVSQSVRLVSFIFFFAHNLWLSVISYHLWRPFKSVNGEEPRFLFLTYNVYVWFPTTILPGAAALIYILDQPTNTVEMFLICAFLTLLISNFFNLTMIILTITHILKLKRQTMKFGQREGEITTSINLDSETHSYLYWLRILFVVVLAWFPLIGYFQNVMKLKHLVFDVNNFICWGYGFWHFILLILNRSTLRLLMDRFRGSPKKQFVRAQRVKSPA
ncbi:G-protein coupled receptor Mth-like [Drosophila subpulchrella]|uniref:G-protein coupled receptor Mth-like n=1 Tax=Drosophila subpulchrella TaxID=1486046 RepID=UPI0018A1A093|nr:G-protein coupled receptor Mth-like [Drosophila subpulchrella]